MPNLAPRLATATLIGAAVFCALLAAAFAPPIQNGDIWWHLATGQYIVVHGSVPKHDIFSYTVAGRRWVTHEWLSELVFWGAYRAGGLRGLILLRALLLGAALLLVFLASARHLGAYVAAPLTALAAYATTRSWLERPQLFTYLGVALFVFLLSKEAPTTRKAAARRFAPLVAATLLWANLHAGFASGVALLGLWALGWGLFHRREPAWRIVLAASVAATFGSLAVALINPNGVGLLTYPFEYLRQPVYPKYVLDWQRTTFTNGPHAVAGALLALALVGAALTLRRSQGGPRLLWLLVFAAMAVSAKRHVPVAVLVATPLLAQAAALLGQRRPALGRCLQRLRVGAATKPGPIVYVLLGAALVALLAKFPWDGSYRACVRPGQFPARCAAFLAERGYQANILCPFNWGGYLIFTLYPACRVAIDPRPDVYGEELVALSWRLDGGPPDWERLVESQRPDLVVWYSDSRLIPLLAASGKWRLVYLDGTAAAFERASQ